MAFVVSAKSGRFELRESANTPKGPRSRTLASFRELDRAVVEKAQERASKALDPAELRRAARRAGAPVARSPADMAARELIAELGKGREPHPILRRMLFDLLSDGLAEDGESSP